MFDLRFHPNSTYVIAGASGCGKTTWVVNVLFNANELFAEPKCMQNVCYYYNQWQTAFNDIRSSNAVTHWLNELPTVDSVKELCTPFIGRGGSVLIIDDFQNQITKDVQEIFTTLSHHLELTVFLLGQNIFSKNKFFRDISLNSKYICLFKSPRDQLQIVSFARQFQPNNSAYVIQSFREATKRPYSYMLFDLHQETPDFLRIKSNIFEHEFPMRIWLAKTCI